MASATFSSSSFIRSPLLRLPYQLVRPFVDRALGLPKLQEVYEAGHRAGGGEAGAFAEGALDALGVSWSIPEADKAALAAVDGPLVVAANHPFGGIDSMAIIALMEQLRGANWNCISTRFLTGIPELEPHCLLVDPKAHPSANRKTLATILKNLKGGGALCVFPAARVSPFSEELGAVCDFPWSEHAVRLATSSGAHLALLHIPGQNSDAFLRIPPAKTLRRTFALVRELANPPGAHVQLTLSGLLGPGEVSRLRRAGNAAERARALCYAGGERVGRDAEEPTGGGGEPRRVSLRSVPAPAPLLESGGFELLRFRGDERPELLEALGRAREITFRAAGQGTGNEVDVSPEDAHYHHLVVRDRSGGELVGAYRLGLTEEILAEHGPAGLYLGHVFEIDPRFYDRLGPAMELSRSFVMPHYQKDSRALALLWQGLGKTATEFGCRNLFGSVTISAAFQPASRALLAAHLRQEHADGAAFADLVRARSPFVPETTYHPLVNAAWRGEPATALWPVVEMIERGARTPPPLIKYYLSLGAKFIDFHVEAAFGDALYCLLRVDLEAMPERYKRRFL